MHSEKNTKEITGEYLKEQAEKVIENALSGERNPLDIFIELKAIQSIITMALKDSKFQTAVLDEIAKYPDKKFGNIGIGESRTGDKFDFSGDHQWDKLTMEINDLNIQRKDREAFLKAYYKGGGKVADTETGEEITVNMIEPGTTSPKITFPK